ncbi:MAG: hypothetical protein KGJ34_01780 [Patescibacteria group bacterium]|nr:hypothetical protein [Patescibacteria group bacterium]
MAWLIRRRQPKFAFLVHPRTDEFVRRDTYGHNDIYRPFPAFRWLFRILPERIARRFVLWFAKTVVPITLSRIHVHAGGERHYGYLLSTVRTPGVLLGMASEETRAHLSDLFWLAAKKGVRRVGLGALLPSMTGYGRRFVGAPLFDRPAVSTGHAYTGYVIVEFLKFLVARRNPDAPVVKVAVAGAAGSTGKAVLRVLKRTWTGPVRLSLQLVDLPKRVSVLQSLAREARGCGACTEVSVSTDLSSLRLCEYVIVVTNASSVIIRPEHLCPGSVVIDDSQPRNTSEDLVAHGCYVIDVLARVPGLDCCFDFGFQTNDPTVTFTCLAETVLATICGETGDLAVGEVTDDVVGRMIQIVKESARLGLVGPLPLFSFGRELTEKERNLVLKPTLTHLAVLPAG